MEWQKIKRMNMLKTELFYLEIKLEVKGKNLSTNFEIAWFVKLSTLIKWIIIAARTINFYIKSTQICLNFLSIHCQNSKQKKTSLGGWLWIIN